MSDLARVARKISRILGTEVVLSPDCTSAVINDRQQSGEVFQRRLGSPSQREACLKRMHEDVYKTRGRVKFKEQKGLCALCGEPMSGTSNTEIDHIKSRGRSGRSDDIGNLRVVHGGLLSCHRQRHGEKVKV